MSINPFPHRFNLKRLSIRFLLSIVTALYVFVPAFADAQSAGSAQLILSPASGSYQVDSTLRLTVNVVSTDGINGAQAVLSYDTAKLQYLSVDTSTSAFTFNCLSSGGSGTVDIACAHLSALTGTRTLGAVNFKVLGGSGTTAISFASSSGIARQSDNQNVWNGNSTGGTYTLTTPSTSPTTPPSTPPSTPPTTPPATGTANPTPKPKVTNTPTTISNTSSGAPAPANATKSVTGYFVAITVVDKEGNPLVNKKVTLAEQTVETDTLGVASFTSVPSGTYDITDEDGKVLANITVAENAENPLGETQKFEVQVKPDNKWRALLLPVLGGLGALVTVAMVFKALRQRHIQKMNHNRHFPTQPNTPTPPAVSGIITPSQTAEPAQPQAPSVITPQTEASEPTPATEGEANKPVVWSGEDKDK